MRAIKFLMFVLIFLLLSACGPVTKTSILQKPSGDTLDDQMNRLTSQIISSFNQSNVQKIAVIEFADLEGNVTQLGRFIAEELITRIFTSGRFEVVERNLLQKVLEEQQLGMTGYIDQATAISLGQILGVDAIITGSLTDLGKNVKINARLISTGTGSVFAVASVNVIKDSTIKLLMGENISNSANSNSNSSQAPQHSGLKPPVVQHGVQFELQKCFYSNDIFSFVFDVTNLDMDKEISILNYTRDDVLRFFDENGNEYQKAEIFLGTHHSRGNSDGVKNKTMIQDVGTQCIMKFYNVSKKPTTVKRLDLLLEIPDLKNVFTITFRDIPVE
jgi:curli biogenesis system outer membrane secretion channel CsgG